MTQPVSRIACAAVVPMTASCLFAQPDPGHSTAAADLSLGPAPVTGALVTDRPDFTESTDAVARGHIQIESGYTFTYDDAAGVVTRSHSAPELLLRVGLFDGVELRIAWPTYTRLDTSSGDADGLEDLNLGVKVKLVEQDGLTPHVGMIGEIAAPTGADALTSDGVDPAVKLLWAYDLPGRVSVGGNVNVASVSEGADRFFQPAASLALGVAATERVGVFVEYFGFYPVSDDSGAAHTLNGGVTFLVHDNLQFDARVGVGLNENADDLFTGVGFALRR